MNKIQLVSKGCINLLLLVMLGSIVSVSCYGQTHGPIDFEHIYSERLDESHNDFNFWIGNWDVVWKSWSGKDVYEPANFSRHRVFALLGGKALIELAYGDSIIQGSKTAGFSIRYFDDNLQKWVMFQSWPGKNSTNISSLQGTYHHRRIQLYKHGKTTRVIRGNPVGTPYENRYTFSDAHKESFRWESGFSLDSMRTWFTGTVAEGVRLPDFESLLDENQNWYTYGDGYNCHDSILAQLQPYLGEWSGEIEYRDGKKTKMGKVTRVLKPFLSNCAALGYQVNRVDGKISREIIFVTYLTGIKKWVFYTLNDRMGESHQTFFSESIGDKTIFTKKDMFDVPSSGTLKEFSWRKVSTQRQVIEGAIPDKDWTFRIELRKMTTMR